MRLIDAKNFGYDVSVRPSVRTDSGEGGGESQGNPTGRGGRKVPSFLGGKSRGAFGQPAQPAQFSWQEIARPSSFLKRRFVTKLKLV